MSVVVEGTPPEAAGVSPIGCQLIVHASMPHRMFSDSLDVIITFCWIHVPDELGVQVQRTIGWPQRNLKIVHRVNIFQHFRVIPESNTTCLRSEEHTSELQSRL